MSEVQEAIYDIFTRYDFSANYIIFGIILLLTILMITNKINKYISILISGLLIYVLFLELGVFIAFIEWVGWYFNNHELINVLNNYNLQYNIMFICSILCLIVQIGLLIYKSVKRK